MRINPRAPRGIEGAGGSAARVTPCPIGVRFTRQGRESVQLRRGIHGKRMTRVYDLGEGGTRAFGSWGGDHGYYGCGMEPSVPNNIIRFSLSFHFIKTLHHVSHKFYTRIVTSQRCSQAFTVNNHSQAFSQGLSVSGYGP